MVERASAQLCLEEGGEKRHRWRRRNGGHRPLCPATWTGPTSSGNTHTPLTHPVSPSPCKKITWKRIRGGQMGRRAVSILLSFPTVQLLATPPPPPRGTEVAAKQVIIQPPTS